MKTLCHDCARLFINDSAWYRFSYSGGGAEMCELCHKYDLLTDVPVDPLTWEITLARRKAHADETSPP